MTASPIQLVELRRLSVRFTQAVVVSSDEVNKMSEFEDRDDYCSIRSELLDTYYDFCRDRGLVTGVSHLEVMRYID